MNLVVVDFDGTLYRSPLPPPNHPTWYYQAYSLDGWLPPGFDQRWNLGLLQRVRGYSLDALSIMILATERPDHKEMRRMILDMLAPTEIEWKGVHLKPVLGDETPASFKARVVEHYLRAHSIQHVIMYDDDKANLDACEAVCLATGKKFTGLTGK